MNEKLPSPDPYWPAFLKFKYIHKDSTTLSQINLILIFESSNSLKISDWLYYIQFNIYSWKSNMILKILKRKILIVLYPIT